MGAAAGGNDSEPQRCVAHGLAAGPDGLCVVCRREQKAISSTEPRIGSALNGWLVLGTAIMVLAAAAILGLGLMRSPDAEIDEGLALGPSEPPPETPASAEEPTAEAQPQQPRQPSASDRRRAMLRAKRHVRIKMYMTDW